MKREFTIDDKEYEVYRDWFNKHNESCKLKNPNNQTTIGGRITFSFTPTGLGTVITVECACGEKVNVTDIEDW